MFGWFRHRRFLQQHLAVFGESGSGKTTLVSTFYGWHHEKTVLQKTGYSLTAVDPAEGQRLHAAYLRLSQSLLPPATRYENRSFRFQINVRGVNVPAGSLVWHDYPGEWWNEEKQGEEGIRQKEAFRALLQSDVAFFLCDAARLKADGPKYIRGLFRQFANSLQRLANELVVDNAKKLSPFPRVWTICLSKADLFPDKDVNWFRDQVIAAAVDELDELRHVIQQLVGGDSYQAVGEDFLLLSSAEIDPATGKVINAKRQQGLDLIAPVAVIVPVKWALRWARAKQTARLTAHRLTRVFKGLTTNWLKYLPIIGNVFWLFDEMLDTAVNNFEQAGHDARARGDAVGAVVAAMAAQLADPAAGPVYLSPSV